MTEQNANKQTKFDVFTTKDGKFMKLGTLDSNTKCVIGQNNNTIFKYKNGSLLSTKTGITYTVDKEGKIYDNGSKVGFIKDYSYYPKFSGFDISSINRKHVIVIASICIGLFIILLFANATKNQTSSSSKGNPTQKQVIPPASQEEFEPADVSNPNNNIEQYSIDDVNQLNGIFILSADGKTLTRLTSFSQAGFPISDVTHFNGEKNYNGESVSLWRVFGTKESVKLNPGEKIILAGTAWSGLSTEQKTKKVVTYDKCVLLGYGNTTYLTDMWYWKSNFQFGYKEFHFDLSCIKAINGIDFSNVVLERKSNAYNDALSKTGLNFIYRESLDGLDGDQWHYTFLAKNQNESVHIDYYEGTQLKNMDLIMDMPFYRARKYGNDGEIPIIVTDSGYFIVDTTSLSAGTYELNLGVYLIEIT